MFPFICYFVLQGRYVVPSVCLSVCLSVCQQLHTKTAEQIFTEILPEIYPSTRKKQLNFETYPILNHEDTKSEKFQHYDSVSSTITPCLTRIRPMRTVNK